MQKYPAIIKWSGSKRLVAEQLSEKFPKFERYFEPFIGGGSMLPYSNGRETYASDIISELISLWNEIKNNPKKVADEYESRWKELQEKGQEVYYNVRDNFNRTRNPYDFLFLSRTCVNGLIRFNANGEFNNSFHLSRPGINPETFREQLILWSNAIKNVTFKTQDYRVTLQDAHIGDFVFLDPPYGGTKGRYTADKFDVDGLYDVLGELNKKNVKWMLTFDGRSGDREYNYAPPSELYKECFGINTGNTVFTKTQNNKVEKIEEMVYINYSVKSKYIPLF